MRRVVTYSLAFVLFSCCVFIFQLLTFSSSGISLANDFDPLFAQTVVIGVMALYFLYRFQKNDGLLQMPTGFTDKGFYMVTVTAQGCALLLGTVVFGLYMIGIDAMFLFVPLIFLSTILAIIFTALYALLLRVKARYYSLK